MRGKTVSFQSTLRLLGLGVLIGAISVFILSSSLATPIALALIGVIILVSVIGVAARKTSGAAPENGPIADPIFVNETWILKR